MNIPDDLRYSAEHEWVRVDANLATVGITDFAQDSLGDVVFVQLPEVGTDVIAGASVSEIESTKSVSDIYAPVSGTVVEVNTALKEKPEAVNSDPHASWMVVLKLSDPAEAGTLLDVTQYADLVK